MNVVQMNNSINISVLSCIPEVTMNSMVEFKLLIEYLPTNIQIVYSPLELFSDWTLKIVYLMKLFRIFNEYYSEND